MAIIGLPDDPDTRRLLQIVNAEFRPNLVVAAGSSTAEVPLLADRPQLDGRATAYVCRRFVCQTPVTTPEDLAAQLG